MTKYRSGKSILVDYPTEAIINEETGERYYDGIKPGYVSSKEIVKILNQYEKEKEELQEDFNDALNRIEERSIDIQLLKKENEQLKHDYGQLQYEMSQIIKEYNELEKENEQLKRKIQKVHGSLINENEQLKKENKALTIGENETILKQEATLNKLLKENEQLKSDIIAIEKRADKIYDENQLLKNTLKQEQEVSKELETELTTYKRKLIECIDKKYDYPLRP